MLVSLAEPPTVAKKRMAYLAETVFPAPDSPLTMMDWFFSSLLEQRRKALVNSSFMSRNNLPSSCISILLVLLHAGLIQDSSEVTLNNTQL